MKAKQKAISDLINKYGHAWVLSYGIIYMVWFHWLEKNVTYHYHVIHSPIDDAIPFVEIFIVPYLLWFLFIALTMGYFFLTSKEEFYKLTSMMFAGMTVFLIVCTLYPNGLQLRPHFFTRDNIFIDMVRFLYRTDTPTNVFPSLHVYNSLCCFSAIYNNAALRKRKEVVLPTFILTVLIILSTMFLKQHSIIDVVGATLMSCFFYYVVYAPAKEKSIRYVHQSF